jgi:hypothetical protein
MATWGNNTMALRHLYEVTPFFDGLGNDRYRKRTAVRLVSRISLRVAAVFFDAYLRNQASHIGLPTLKALLSTWYYSKFYLQFEEEQKGSPSINIIAEMASLGGRVAINGSFATASVPHSTAAAATIVLSTDIVNCASSDVTRVVTSVLENALKCIELAPKNLGISGSKEEMISDFWKAIDSDAIVAKVETSKSPPIWPSESSDIFADYWRFGGPLMPSMNDMWLWYNWYDEVIAGKDGWTEEQTIEILRIPKDLWEQGPAVVNKKIREILALDDDAGQAELPEPFDLAPQFGIGEQGEIVLEQSPPRPADPNKASDIHFVYAEVRSKNLELLNLGPNTLGELNAKALELRERLPEEFDEANIFAVHSTTSSLRIKLKLHQDEHAKPAADQNYAVMLDQTCAEYLSGLVGQLNIFMFLEARGRELDKVSLGPEERARAVDELKAVAPAVTNIFNVASGAAVQVVGGNNSNAINAPKNTVGDQAVDQGIKTNSNFFTRLLGRARAIATWATKAAIGALVGDLAITQWGVYGPAIVAFVKTHASQISRFLMSVYNNNPAIQKIIDFIVTNAPI